MINIIQNAIINGIKQPIFLCVARCRLNTNRQIKRSLRIQEETLCDSGKGFFFFMSGFDII